MQIHAILLTRNAEDVIAENIQAALTWADRIYVRDTGSVDATAKQIADLACGNQRIIVLDAIEVDVFGDGLRADVFNEVRKYAQHGDWFVHLDEDEFFHDDPRVFIESLRKPETAIWSQLIEFRLTRAEATQLAIDSELQKDRSKPLISRRRYYKVLEYSEPRLFRYRNGMTWRNKDAFPCNAGYVAKQRIMIRHYPHRDPVQLRQRLELRQNMLKKLPPGVYPHWHLSLDELLIDESATDLHYWCSGKPLPRVHHTNHIVPRPKRFMQWCLHRFGVDLADRLRTLSLL